MIKDINRSAVEIHCSKGWRHYWEDNLVQIQWEIYKHKFLLEGNQVSATTGKPSSNLSGRTPLPTGGTLDHLRLPVKGRYRQIAHQLLVVWDYLLQSHITA